MDILQIVNKSGQFLYHGKDLAAVMCTAFL